MQTMRRAAVLVVIVCIVLSACSQISGKPAQPEYLVFILAGGSNMVGRGDTSKLPATLKNQSANIEFYLSGRLEKITTRSNFGPEVTFSDEITKAFPHQKIMLIKHAQDGTSLSEWSQDRSLYKNLIDFVRKSTNGKTVEFGAVIWNGGGEDAKANYSSEKYSENFQGFIERIRADIGSKNTPFIYALIDPPIFLFPGREQVRQAQVMIEQKVPNTKMVSADGLSKISDDSHFDTEGQLELGKRYAQAYLQISRK